MIYQGTSSKQFHVGVPNLEGGGAQNVHMYQMGLETIPSVTGRSNGSAHVALVSAQLPN